MLIVKGMWWACIRTNFMIAVAQKTCFYQKIIQKIHWNVARQSYNFFFIFFFNCFLRGCIDKRISLWHILLINMTWGIKLHGQKGSQCCNWDIRMRKMAKTHGPFCACLWATPWPHIHFYWQKCNHRVLWKWCLWRESYFRLLSPQFPLPPKMWPVK